jgi:uncharacterized metal-binding protein YceD (DUF177 family)
VTPEFSRPFDTRRLPEAPLHLTAEASERAGLAKRFGIEGIKLLTADVALAPWRNGFAAAGRLDAELTQACAVSGEPLAVTIAEPFEIRFVPARPGTHSPDEEIELAADECDEIEMEGTLIDLGEAVAQTLALAIDPYATGPEADVVRREVGLSEEAASGPFAALAALKSTSPPSEA